MPVTQERRKPAAEPPKHPSGLKTGADGTWGEGRPAAADLPPISAATAPDKRGSPVPSIGIAGAPGEAASFAPASMPDKRGGAPAVGVVGGPGAEAATADAAAPAQGPRDPCGKASPKVPDGSAQLRREPGEERAPSPQHGRACVRSAARGRDGKRRVPSAFAPDGAFSVLSGESSAARSQGPAGGLASSPAKPAGYGTAHVPVGSCAPEGPSMTVKPPAHPALAAVPRRRPPPSVPAFGARAALPSASSGDGETRAPRGLSVSSVHISGPLAVAGPRLSRRGALAEAPDDALADDPAPAGHRQPAAPGGTPGQGAEAAGMFTPSAGQEAAARAGGGGGGAGTAAHQHAENRVGIDEIRDDKRTNAAMQVGYDQAAAKKKNTLEYTLSKDLGKDLGELQGLRDDATSLHHEKGKLIAEEVAAKKRGDTKTASEKREQWKKVEKEFVDSGPKIAAKEAQIKQTYDAGGYPEIPPEVRAKSGTGELAAENLKADAAEAERKAQQNKAEGRKLQDEENKLQYKNRALEDEMDPADRARSDRETERMRERRERDREREKERRRKQRRRDELRRQRPGYRAGQRAKARRSLARATRLKDKATRLRNAAKNPNLSKGAKKNLLAKAKKLTQKREAEAWRALEAARESGDEKAEADAIEEIKAAQEEEKAIEKEEKALEGGEEPAAAPPKVDPCTLPCRCNILCHPPELCECSREPAPPDPPVDPDPGPPAGGRGQGPPPPPDIKIPEGRSVAQEPKENGDGEDKDGDDEEKKPRPRGGGGGGGPVRPPGVGGGPWAAAPPGTVALPPPAPPLPGGSGLPAGGGGGGSGALLLASMSVTVAKLLLGAPDIVAVSGLSESEARKYVEDCDEVLGLAINPDVSWKERLRALIGLYKRAAQVDPRGVRRSGVYLEYPEMALAHADAYGGSDDRVKYEVHRLFRWAVRWCHDRDLIDSATRGWFSAAEEGPPSEVSYPNLAATLLPPWRLMSVADCHARVRSLWGHSTMAEVARARADVISWAEAQGVLKPGEADGMPSRVIETRVLRWCYLRSAFGEAKRLDYANRSVVLEQGYFLPRREKPSWLAKAIKRLDRALGKALSIGFEILLWTAPVGKAPKAIRAIRSVAAVRRARKAERAAEALKATRGSRVLRPAGTADDAMSIGTRSPLPALRITRPIGELRKEGLKDAHHVIQDAAVRDLPGYNPNEAPGVQLPGPSTAKGTPHYAATQAQSVPGRGGTYGAEREVAYESLRKAGVPEADARRAIAEADEYFRSIGVDLNTPTGIPGNRR